MKICNNCGAQNGDEFRFCSSCGIKFKTENVDSLVETEDKRKDAPVSVGRLVTVILSYIAAYLFLHGTECAYSWEALLIFAMVVVSVELVNRDKPRAGESYIWLACFALNCISYCFHLDRAWEDYQTAIFSIIFGVWWILSRSGKLMENRSGHLLPCDAWTGFAMMPFKGYLLRFRTIVAGIKSLRKGGKDEGRGRIWWIVLASGVCICLFVCAANLLMDADTEFEILLGSFFDIFDFQSDGTWFTYIFFSIPCGCLACGLILGSAEDDRSGIDRRKNRLCIRLASMRRVPGWLWIAVICLFSVMYITFFILQGTYLFGAFSGKLPEGFIVAEYARQGFFEMSKVMIVNSALLWMATRMVSAEAAGKKAFKVACLVLLAESILFSVIAFSKLAMYISIYGYTQLRIQSTWLVCTLSAACILWAYTILTDRPVFRKWMFFGAATLSILAVI